MDDLSEQQGLLSLAQLRGLKVSRGFRRHRIASGRWVQRTSNVIGTTTGPMTREQLLWQAVLHAGPDALVGGLTAAGLQGLKNWPRDDITVLVPNALSFEPLTGVQYVRTRRPLADLRGRGDLPVCRLEPAVLMFAAAEPHRRTAHGAVAACLQQRLTSTKKIGEWLARLNPLPRSTKIELLLRDLDGGAHSMAEIDVTTACKEFGVAPPARQVRRRDRRGRLRFTDCEWKLADGRTLVLEVDGGFHDEVSQRADDRARQRALTTTGRIVVSCSAHEIRYEAWAVMEDLIALGVPRV